MTALRLHSRCRDEKQAHYLWVLGIKLNSGHLDLWTAGKAHKTARISQRPGSSRSFDNDADKYLTQKIMEGRDGDAFDFLSLCFVLVRCINAVYAVL